LNAQGRSTAIGPCNLPLMTPYQQEQLESLHPILSRLNGMAASERAQLKNICQPYIIFRQALDRFLDEHFRAVCTSRCYTSRRSACCSRDGIITFFADMVISVVHSDAGTIAAMESRLKREDYGDKCVYLGENGCSWKIRPIVCAMFLCDRAQQDVLETNPEKKDEWARFEETRKRFTWPDRPVLFDDLERLFIDAGTRTSLMYLHNSPGLLRIKEMAAKR
jgi:hypothetical protein